MELFNYLKTTFQNNFKVLENEKIEEKLPIFIKGNYDLFTIELYKTKFICMNCKNDLSNKKIISNYDYVRNELNIKTIVTFNKDYKIELRDRNYLINKNVNICVPNSQLFIPEIGVILKEKIKNTINKEKFTAADQLIFTYIFLYSNINEPLDPFLIEKKLNTTNTTIKRGMNLLLQFNLIEVEKIGNKNYIKRTLSKEEYFNKAKEHLISPIKTKYFIDINDINIKLNLLSGDYALSKLTMLSELHEVYGISIEEDKLIDNKYKCEKMYDDVIEINVFHRNPHHLSSNNNIDIISIYSIMSNSNDPRILKELDNLMKEYYSE